VYYAGDLGSWGVSREPGSQARLLRSASEIGGPSRVLNPFRAISRCLSGVSSRSSSRACPNSSKAAGGLVSGLFIELPFVDIGVGGVPGAVPVPDNEDLW